MRREDAEDPVILGTEDTDRDEALVEPNPCSLPETCHLTTSRPSRTRSSEPATSTRCISVSSKSKAPPSATSTLVLGAAAFRCRRPSPAAEGPRRGT